MKSKTRPTFAVLALLAASLACSLPGQIVPGVLTSTATMIPSATQAALVSVPTTPAPTQEPSISADASPNQDFTATLTPIPPTFTGTATATQTSTAIAMMTASATITPKNQKSPTAPSTLTPSKSVTATLTRTATRTAQLPAGVVQASFFGKPPVLDGFWDEWKDRSTEYPARNLVFGASNWTGPADLESSFRAAWDMHYLYLAVKVKDDIYVQNASGADLYRGDSLELLLDTNLSGDSADKSLNGDDFQLGMSFGRPDVDGTHESFLWFPRNMAGARFVQTTAVRQDGISRIEAAIPWAVFGISPAVGQRFGFVLSVSDNDNPDLNQQQSMVSNVPGRVLVDPTTWGDLWLK